MATIMPIVLLSIKKDQLCFLYRIFVLPTNIAQTQPKFNQATGYYPPLTTERASTLRIVDRVAVTTHAVRREVKRERPWRLARTLARSEE